jgi:glycerol transport system ATP-binding protein
VATIELENITHNYPTPGGGTTVACRSVNLAWEDGSACALLGPSGCGKTTLLNIISGLLRPSEGRVLVDGRDVTALAPKTRGVAQVFQFPVVYDTISVFHNLAFPLRNAGMPAAAIRERVEEIAGVLDLTGRLDRHAGRISQAEKQKVSLGRGIVRRDTAAILLDEPLTVIDPKEKYALRRKLKQVQAELRITMIYVTHDQHEALTFADSVTVMKDGEVVQTGTPEDLHTDPVQPFVGYFIGSPGMNLLECRVADRRLDFGPFALPISDGLSERVRGLPGTLVLGIRPEYVDVARESGAGTVPWQVKATGHMGTHGVVTLLHEGLCIRSRVPEHVRLAPEDTVWVRFPEERIKVFHNGRKVV